ncbi:uncharacterized protein HMPREF1541_10816 [Cyphellophora europaea CBS 101466]|uniref:Chromo domain-containing protein n=1 Tax=Cyphellophora europaea (strain CBS 101466) TaxID=1220924 RepID=W2S6K7_CYPE1|nr:uncharacterized protein HMPREF1541_10816 [Cyphellophora europaea CBS 101466]ETN44265.1 hypothetical protein HMPREF1541_10816 [Cyphellophora europaea CBS 101466]
MKRYEFLAPREQPLLYTCLDTKKQSTPTTRATLSEMSSMKGRAEDEGDDDPELDVAEEEGDIYAIQRILAERTNAGTVEYLVLWSEYADYESTWEVASQFQDDETIVQWKRQLAAGDTLDDQQLADLERRMREHEERQIEEAEKIYQDLDDSSQAEMASSSTSAQADQPPSKKRRIDSPAQLNNGPFPLLKNRASGRTQPGRAESAMKTTTKPPPPRPINAEPTRQPSVGSKFRNLRHMGNARKKAAEEPQVNPDDPNLKFISTDKQMSLPPIDPPSPDGSLLFFPESTARAEDNSVPSVMTKKFLITPKPTGFPGSPAAVTDKPTSAPATSLPKPADTTSVPVISPPKQAKGSDGQSPASGGSVHFGTQPQHTARNGRVWAKNELVVHITVGPGVIGDVKIVNLAEPARAVLLNYKKAMNKYEINLNFAQDHVMQPTQLREISKYWRDLGLGGAPIKPFDDTAEGCKGFSEHLQRYDSTAAWYHPDSSLILLLFSPNSPPWSHTERYKNMQARPDLVMEVRESIQGMSVTAMATLAPPPNRRTVVCWYWGAGKACWYGDECKFLHPAGPAASLPALIEAKMQSKSGLEEAAPAASCHPVRPAPVRRQSIAGVESAQSPKATIDQTADPRIDNERRKSVHGIADSKLLANLDDKATDMDWSFDTDYRALVKLIKNSAVIESRMPFVFVAFTNTHDIQAQALKAWAIKQTSPRCVFGENDLKEFHRFATTTDPSLFFFYEGDPSYTCLESFHKFLHREEVVCHTVSWETSPATHTVRYKLKPLFPQGQLVLITEDVFLSKPINALSLLKWYETHYKGRGSSYKLMVRPNIRSFLETRALALAEMDDQDELKAVLDLLVLVNELSSPTDVTIPGSTKLLTEPLGTDDVVKQSSFVPFPRLPGYDHTPTASLEQGEVMKRDQFLIEYFIEYSIAESSRFKRFLVVRGEKGPPVADSQHIAFRTAATFVRELEKPKMK